MAHHFVTFIVQNPKALINVTKGPLTYEQHQHFLFVLVSTVAYMVLNIQLLKNFHPLSLTNPILVCFRFCVQHLSYILIYLFIYLWNLFHFSIKPTSYLHKGTSSINAIIQYEKEQYVYILWTFVVVISWNLVLGVFTISEFSVYSSCVLGLCSKSFEAKS